MGTEEVGSTVGLLGIAVGSLEGLRLMVGLRVGSCVGCVGRADLVGRTEGCKVGPLVLLGGAVRGVGSTVGRTDGRRDGCMLGRSVGSPGNGVGLSVGNREGWNVYVAYSSTFGTG